MYHMQVHPSPLRICSSVEVKKVNKLNLHVQMTPPKSRKRSLSPTSTLSASSAAKEKHKRTKKSKKHKEQKNRKKHKHKERTKEHGSHGLDILNLVESALASPRMQLTTFGVACSGQAKLSHNNHYLRAFRFNHIPGHKTATKPDCSFDLQSTSSHRGSANLPTSSNNRTSEKRGI